MNQLLDYWTKDTQEFKINFSFEFLKQWKKKRILITIILTFFVSLSFYLVPEIGGGDFPATADEFLKTSMQFVDLLIIFSAMFLGGDSINRESHDKTSLLIYTLPQRRTILIITKFLVNLLLAWIALLLYYFIMAVNVTIIYGYDAIPKEILRSLLFAMLYQIVILSLAFFLSVIMKSPASSMSLTFFSAKIIIPLTSVLLGIIEVNTWWIFTDYSSIITDVFRFPSEVFALKAQNEDLNFYTGVKVILGYSASFLASSLVLGNKKEV